MNAAAAVDSARRAARSTTWRAVAAVVAAGLALALVGSAVQRSVGHPAPNPADAAAETRIAVADPSAVAAASASNGAASNGAAADVNGAAAKAAASNGAAANAAGSNGVAANGVGSTGAAANTSAGASGLPPVDAAVAGRPHAGNPFAGAQGYVNPDYAALVRAAAQRTGGSLGTSMATVAQYPTAVWLDRIAAVTGGAGVQRTLRGHLDAALAQQRSTGRQVVATFVVYDLPDRDCAAAASNGELTITKGGLAAYRTRYIDPLATALADPRYAALRIVTLVEPDSLPNLVTNQSVAACAQAQSSGVYVSGVQYALDRLHAIGNVYTYVDIAHSGWLGWDSNFGPAVDLITQTVRGTRAGLRSVDGFVSNTAGYTPLDEPYLPDPNRTVGGAQVKSAAFYEGNPYLDERDYASAMRRAFLAKGFPSSIGMLVDTGRDGWGGAGRPVAVSASSVLQTFVQASRIDRRAHRGNWCNQAGGIGARPTAAPAAGFDAYLWVKPPGESDGTSNTAQTTADAEGKRFDAMCDPTGQSRYAPAFPTGAMAGAPSAGHWFDAQFATLVRNAWPKL